MDPNSVQTLVNALQAAHTEITTQMNNVQGAASNATWMGPDATHFQSEWSSAHGQLTQAVSQLQALHTYTSGKLSQQESASQA
jgi:hypothetical protein